MVPTFAEGVCGEKYVVVEENKQEMTYSELSHLTGGHSCEGHMSQERSLEGKKHLHGDLKDD